MKKSKSAPKVEARRLPPRDSKPQAFDSKAAALAKLDELFKKARLTERATLSAKPREVRRIGGNATLWISHPPWFIGKNTKPAPMYSDMRESREIVNVDSIENGIKNGLLLEMGTTAR